jgi:hypothetical protein
VAGVALALGCSAKLARADGPSARRAEPFRLVWSSSADCGNARNFLAELEGRTALLREAREDEHAATLIVATFRAPGGVRGQLTVRKSDGDLTVREVAGLDCREVESAMALIVALMMDPLAAGSERPALKALPPATGHGSSLRPSAWSWRVEQRLTARTAIAPGLTWGQSVGGMLTREMARPRPSVGLSVHLAHATTSALQGSAELEWTAAQLTLCPAGLRPSDSWDLRACAAFQLGRLRGMGFRTFDPATKAILWSSVALEVEGRYRLLGPSWLGWEGAFTMPFSRESFYVEPGQTLHTVPAWGVSFGLGLGLHFL